MEWEEKQEAFERWVGTDWLRLIEDRDLYREINAAFYSAGELASIPEMRIHADLAMKIWAIVEKVRKDGFPEELRL